MQAPKTPRSKCQKHAKLKNLSMRSFGPISSPDQRHATTANQAGDRTGAAYASSAGDSTAEVFYAIPLNYVAQHFVPIEEQLPQKSHSRRCMRHKDRLHAPGCRLYSAPDYASARLEETSTPGARSGSRSSEGVKKMSKRAMTYYYMNHRLRQFPFVYDHSKLEEVVEEDEPCEEPTIPQTKDVGVQVNPRHAKKNLIGDLRKRLVDALEIVEKLSEAKKTETKGIQYEYPSIEFCPFDHVARLEAALERMRPRF